ncbi:MAG: NAD(P)/FAD-dependent oxidoreductase [Leptolyngbya sp. SIO1D8]|nr:NAD(P)/FAD-dependent oxidoreductase [Leptolyngbya sp. SIO1D8]
MSTSSTANHLSATDILIVGAGPAGATASLFLAQAQIPHTLIDKAIFPREKADGNVYGVKVIEILNRLDPSYFSELITQTDQVLGCTTAQVFTPNDKSFNLRFPQYASDRTDNQASAEEYESKDVPFFTMNRRHFDHFLVSKLNQNYVDQRFNTAITALERQPHQWHVTLETAGQIIHLHPKLVIAADGANSTVLQKLGLRQPVERYYDSVQGYFRGIKGFETTNHQLSVSERVQYVSHIEAHFLPQSNPGFFFITPLANDIFSVGVGKPRRDQQAEQLDLPQLLQEVMNNHPQLAANFVKAEPVSDLRPWPVMVGVPGQISVSGEGYLITGDAAGLCHPLTCFGTGNAMISGLLAAEQAKQCITQQCFDAAALKAYDRALYKRFQKEFQVGNILKRFTKRDWLFNWVTNSHQVQSLLRKRLKGTSAALKKL